jgi:hypothetical protein
MRNEAVFAQQQSHTRCDRLECVRALLWPAGCWWLGASVSGWVGGCCNHLVRGQTSNTTLEETDRVRFFARPTNNLHMLSACGGSNVWDLQVRQLVHNHQQLAAEKKKMEE